jgi:dTMP kinase
MGESQFYGEGLPGVDVSELRGKLIVLEGTDGVGRTTQVALLRSWLESNGHAVLDTGMTRSALAGNGLRQAKAGHTLDVATLALFYATDFADRLEHEMIPALRAGFVVLTDRYIYSLIARAVVRGADPSWIHDVYGFALVPHAIMYLRIGIEDLIPRVLHSTGFDYWESGMDQGLGEDRYDSFCAYQGKILAQFDAMAQTYGFETFDASRSIEELFDALRSRVEAVLGGP